MSRLQQRREELKARIRSLYAYADALKEEKPEGYLERYYRVHASARRLARKSRAAGAKFRRRLNR